jgi:hypothetical protein
MTNNNAYHFRFGNFIREDIRFDKNKVYSKDDTLAIFIADSINFHKKIPFYNENKPHLCQNRFYKFGYLGAGGKIIIPFVFDGIQATYDSLTLTASINNLHGIIDGKGNTIIPFKYYSVYTIDNNLFAVLDKRSDTLLKFYNRKFEYLFSAKGSYAEVFSKDYIKISPLSSSSKSTAPYIISKQGKVVPVSLENTISWIDNNFICVYKNQKCGIVDFKNNTLVPFEYVNIGVGCKGQFIVIRDGKSGIIDAKNKIIVPLNDVNITSLIGCYLIENRRSDISQLVDLKGQEILSGHYRISTMNSKKYLDKVNADELLWVYNTDTRLYGIYNVEGIKIQPVEYNFISTHRDIKPCSSIIIEKKVSPNSENSLHALLDKNGKIIVPLSENKIDFINEIPNLVKSTNADNLCALVNANTGKVLTPYQYENFEHNYKLFSGYLLAKKNYRYALVSPDGRILTEAVYHEFIKATDVTTLSFDEEIIYLARKHERYFGITKDGKEIVPQN